MTKDRRGFYLQSSSQPNWSRSWPQDCALGRWGDRV